MKPKHILVYRLSALGDVAMTIPAIYSCAKAWPDVVFHTVTTAFCAQLFVNKPNNLVVHPIEMPVNTFRVLKLLNRLHVDAVADMHNVLRSWVVDALFLMKGKRVCMINKIRGERKAILRRKRQTERPFTLRYFDVFEQLGLGCKPCFTSLFPVLPPLPINRTKGSEYWIGVAPFARYPNKSYPIDLMQQVVWQLAAQEGVRVFLFGCRGQEEMMKQWECLSVRVESVAGRFMLQQELSLMAHLDVMLSMDSANMHLASLVGTRVVSIWGSTTPACGFLGYGQHESDAICAHVSCQPCTIGGSKQCRHGGLVCMRSVSPETIVERITNQA